VTTTHIIILLATGVGVGFAGGLLGLGGAFIMTPVQYFVFTNMGLPTDLAIKLACGTSSLVVLTLAASGAWRHSLKGVVRWKAAVIMGVCGSVFAFGGATLAAHLSGTGLKIAFGALILASALRMLTARMSQTEASPRENPWLLVACAVPIGFICGIFGIGGGIVLIPVLMLVLRFRIHNAIGTSLAIMLFTAAGGAIGYLINGLGVAGLPDYSMGYIYLPSWGLLAVTSVGMAQLGAIAAHKLPARLLNYIFIAIMLYMGLKMLGLFDWLGWPI
jgi:uncharacterized membrane protein YfcA